MITREVKPPRDDFAVFILSHGRADRIHTLKSLEKSNYTGKWYVVIDNEDKTADEYYKRYGDRVLMFDKLEMSKTFDTADLSQDRRTIVYARNACFDLAKQVGVKYFCELDDDYTGFYRRYETDGKLASEIVPDFNALCDAMIEFLECSNAKTVAFAQAGDLMGGKDSHRWSERVLRKAMNSFFCSVERPFQFVGRINEDVNTYTVQSQRGDLFFTICDIALVQKQTQSNKAGMTGVYLDGGTYLKSFYTILFSPSCVKVASMGTSHKRLHHNVNWEHCAPKILNEKWRKRG